jgi:NAD(P)-dependent dehydrogenase (short-subunit alcohol dehydrogenase family)
MTDAVRPCAVVTGAGRGLGRGIAVALAQRGFDLVLGWHSDRAAIQQSAKECEAAGARTCCIQGDVAEPETAAVLAEAGLEQFGRVSAWVNNAGVSVLAPLLDTSAEAMASMTAVNLLGTFHGMQAAARAMAGGGGRIVNVASDLGVQGAPLLAGYCATKFAVVGLTQAAAIELAPLGISINAVCPGTVETDMVLSEIEAEAAVRGVSAEETRERLRHSVPAGRMCTVDDVAALVVWLVGEGSDFVTGQAICVNGGSILH